MYKKVLRQWKLNDPVLYTVACKVGMLQPIKKEKPENYFFRLCREIICQQLSNKAGDTLVSRFKGLFTEIPVTSRSVLAISHDRLRSSGMSHAKARYIRNLAESVESGELSFSGFDSMTNEEVSKKLLRVKGIGPWTCEMFLMFVLARDNVFSHGDLGLRKAIRKIYKLHRVPSKKRIEQIVSKWAPYKTYASRVLWASMDTQ